MARLNSCSAPGVTPAFMFLQDPLSHTRKIRFVGLYIVRAPASASRLQLAEDGLLKYLAKGSIPNVSRGKAAKRALPPDQTNRVHTRKEDSESDWIKERKKSWAALIKLIYEADPLLCPKCHTQMKIISVIKDGAVIDKILHHLQYKFEILPLSARPPPPQRSCCDPDFALDSPVWTEGD